jgi:transcriptional regulator with XRE-family HTH domain
VKSFVMGRTKPPYYEMGQRIITAREGLTELSQSQMTEALGLREPTYGNYERGSRKMPPHIMEKFKKLTGVSVDWVYLGSGTMVDLMSRINQLNSDHLKSVEFMIEAYLREQGGS